MNRLILVILVAFAFIAGCKNEETTIKEDAKELVKIEKQIVDLTIKANSNENPMLSRKADSLTTVLQKRSNELQLKYKKLNKIKDFQEAYQKVKEEVFKK
ncbi:hypothetical protein L21SP5_01205 [Salinivirga cyanobacteriivorans]|uniref:Uncharacterized protein n=1 Tax=Salinivirga cyanobacteriivorans TaxID=1307839 RepID=A0A0S2HYG2_9BACT|nr:hypothetical protein [Salinivirga cyanobacteriivorans]ALO14860.1 hypothetical protein L21SP5_01205 [Salinivirga cyanobacteriivorans]